MLDLMKAGRPPNETNN